MGDYKSAKEAFVSDNPGASIWSINAVSLVALATYALWIALSPYIRHGLLNNTLICVLPLLFGVTIFSTSPLVFTSFLSILSLAFITKSQKCFKSVSSPEKPKGQWLDESDSDEEPAEPASAAGSAAVSPVKLLPSQVAFASGSLLSPDPTTSPMSPSSSSASGHEDPLGIMGVNRRRSLLEGVSLDVPSHIDSKVRISPVPYLRLKKSRATKAQWVEEKGRLPFLTVYRAHMMLMTVICILAVDFEVFPRWQGKCEDFGTSLMDVGVGSFVFSLGLVSTKSLSPPPPTPTPSSPALNSHIIPLTPSPFTSILISLRKSIPILVLGFIRLIMVKGSDYPEHVTEYGVHWNFFFTLALVPVLAVGIRPLTQWLRWSVLGVIISLLHQLWLTYYLQSIVFSFGRSGIFLANKEGFSSLPGYLSIFLIGLSIGDHVLRLSLPPRRERVVSETNEEHEQSHFERKKLDLIMELIGYSLGWWALLGGWIWAGGEVSRRLANAPYVFWVAAYNTTFLLGYLLLTHIIPSPTSSQTSPSILVPPLLDAMNKNGLAIFLAANLLTGLVNVSMKTMYAPAWLSMGVLMLYTLTISCVGWILKGRRIKI
ncbi:GPI-anchored wall transfer protein 1 [Cryptococcus neoformans var. grubii Br795]|nr:GPI-anchored wall transfer protein 1 [Cryptococcus neoformans var. grubii Br795]